MAEQNDACAVAHGDTAPAPRPTPPPPGDPVADISVMKRVSFVMKDGIVYKLNSTAVDAP